MDDGHGRCQARSRLADVSASDQLLLRATQERLNAGYLSLTLGYLRLSQRNSVEVSQLLRALEHGAPASTHVAPRLKRHLQRGTAGQVRPVRSSAFESAAHIRLGSKFFS